MRITSTKNDFVKYAKSLKSKKGRKENGAFLIEGEKCVSELMTHMPETLQSLVAVDGAYKDITANAGGLRDYTVTDQVMDAICDCKTPQGIAAIAKIPAHQEVRKGFILALDGVKDPQNVGTMIRTADAGGCSGVALSEECADCYSPKAVRASMGSLFHIPVFRTDLQAYIVSLKEAGYHVSSAHLEGKTEYDHDWEMTCLVIGNESVGVSEKIQKIVDGFNKDTHVREGGKPERGSCRRYTHIQNTFLNDALSYAIMLNKCKEA